MWDNEASRLLDNSHLGLHHNLRLLNNSNLRRWLNNSNTTHWCSHALELGAHDKPATITHSDLFLLGAKASEHIEGNTSFRDHLEWMTLIFDDDVHLMLKHIGWDRHELKGPFRVLAAVMAGLCGEVHATDLDMHDRGHLMKRTANFVVELSV